MAKSRATGTWDPRDEPFASVENTQAPDEPKPSRSSPSLRINFLRFQNTETSDKKSRRERKQQRRQDEGRGRNSGTPAARVNTPRTPKARNGARKGLSQMTCYNCRKKGRYAKNCPEPQKEASEN